MKVRDPSSGVDERPAELATSDGERLVGRLSMPDRPVAGVVLCHPHPLYGGSMDNLLITTTQSAVRDGGAATLRFNFRSVGGSTGTHGGGTGELLDVAAALDFLDNELRSSRQPGGPDIPLAIVGYSFGTWVGLRAGLNDLRVGQMVGIAPTVRLVPFDFLKESRAPVLLIAGDRDEYGPVTEVRAVASRAGFHVTVAPISGADHFFVGRSTTIARRVASFLWLADSAGAGPERSTDGPKTAG